MSRYLVLLAALACAERPDASEPESVTAPSAVEPEAEEEPEVPEPEPSEVEEPEVPEVEEPEFPEPEAPDVEEPEVLTPIATGMVNGGVMAAHGATWLVADTDNHEVLVMDESIGLRQRLDFDGGEPTRVVVSGDHAFLTLRASGEVAHLAWTAAGWSEVARVDAGAEPFGIALVEGHLFVTASQSDAVLLFDAATLARIDERSVPGEPRWLVPAVDEDDGPGIIAVSAGLPGVSWVPLIGGVVTTELPQRQRYNDNVSSACIQRPLARRNTGDPTVLPDGRILVPAVHVDNQLRAALTEPYWCASQPEAPPIYYAPPMPPASEKDVGRWNPILQVFTLSGGDLLAGSSSMIDTSRGTDMIRSIPTGAHAWTVGGVSRVVVAMETADELVLVDPSVELTADAGFEGWWSQPIHTRGMPQLGGSADAVMTWSLHERVLTEHVVSGTTVAATERRVPMNSMGFRM